MASPPDGQTVSPWIWDTTRRKYYRFDASSYCYVYADGSVIQAYGNPVSAGHFAAAGTLPTVSGAPNSEGLAQNFRDMRITGPDMPPQPNEPMPSASQSQLRFPQDQG